MADQEAAGADRAALLRREFLGQTARIPWQELQTHFAHGNVVWVAPALDLVEVEFDAGANSSYDTDAYKQELVKRVEAPAKVELFLIVNPPSWFGVIWKIMKPMLAPSFRKRVKICPESRDRRPRR